MLLALGPLIGLALAPSPDTLTVVAAVGAVALAGVGVAVERAKRADRLTMTVTVIAAAVAVAAGARFGPTGVEALDVVLAFCFIVVVTQAADGLGNVDGLATGIGAASAAGLFALAGFGGQDDLATVALGLFAGCFAFLAFNMRPASLFVGRAGRLAIGYTLAVGVLAVHVVPSAPRELVIPPMLVAVLLVDAAVVAVDRLRRRHPLGTHRTDHLVHRLALLGWSPGEAVILLVIAQVLLSVIGVFTGRAVMPLWLGGALAALVVLVLVVEAERAQLEHDRAPGFTLTVKLVIGAFIVAVIAGVAPVALALNDAKTLMENGREAASRGLASARDGDAITASASFHEAALTFAQARDKLESPLLSGGLAIPLLAPNVRAARALAEIGTDLADAGESVTLAVDPAALEVVDGRLPLEEVRTILPKLREGAAALARANRRLDEVRDDPYLAAPVRDALDKVHTAARAGQPRGAARGRCRGPRARHLRRRGAAHLSPRRPEQRRVAGDRRFHRELWAHHRARRQTRRWRPAADNDLEQHAAQASGRHVQRTRRLPHPLHTVRPRHHAPERQPVARFPERGAGADEPRTAGRAHQGRRRARGRPGRARRAPRSSPDRSTSPAGPRGSPPRTWSR